jgi:hypothetical protein
VSTTPDVTTDGKDRVAEDRADEESPFTWEWRVMAVSAFWALPGVLFGALARLCVPDGGPASWWLAGGAVLGATLGGLLEADHFLG